MRHRLLIIGVVLDLFWWVGYCYADPPKLTVPEKITATVGDFVEINAETDAKWVRYFPLSTGVKVFPPGKLADKTGTVILCNRVGNFRILAYTGNDDGGTEKIVTVEFKPEPGQPPPVDPTLPPEKPPTDPPPPQPTEGLYFLIVRPDGQATPELTRIMGLPEWDQLRQKKHLAKDKTVTEADTLGVRLPEGTRLPCVVTLKTVTNAEGKKVSALVRGPIDLPTDGAGILNLPEGIK